MARVMMRLGVYKFSLDTAAYQELQRSASYRWARQERIGTNDALQFTGIGPETVDLRGVVFPLFRGGLDQVSRMRLQASLGLPLPMIDGLGKVWGLWAVEQINERQSVFMAGGAPNRIEFDLRLARYDGGAACALTVLRLEIPPTALPGISMPVRMPVLSRAFLMPTPAWLIEDRSCPPGC